MSTKIAADRFENFAAPAHDDMLGILSTGIAGANQWNVKNVNDTLYPLPFLRDNSNDFACIRIQSPHWRKQGVVLDSIHIHYVLDSAPGAGETALFNVYYTWCYPGSAIPALTGWTLASNVTKTFVGTEPAWYYGLFSFVTDIPAPTSEGYGLYLLCRVVRGNGTFSGEIGILDIDAHAQKDRLGSINEASDS